MADKKKIKKQTITHPHSSSFPFQNTNQKMKDSSTSEPEYNPSSSADDNKGKKREHTQEGGESFKKRKTGDDKENENDDDDDDRDDKFEKEELKEDEDEEEDDRIYDIEQLAYENYEKMRDERIEKGEEDLGSFKTNIFTKIGFLYYIKMADKELCAKTKDAMSYLAHGDYNWDSMILGISKEKVKELVACDIDEEMETALDKLFEKCGTDCFGIVAGTPRWKKDE